MLIGAKFMKDITLHLSRRTRENTNFEFID